ncbi:hypothetical protein Zmor_008506 [Zophobas morio]|uniref:Uncharacterized protein n=1 Tax=Zophobas morio TaxID=2755281 RepID=A0AA38MN18_9CUCU|nr:hypothetical protein Zmor_008506 [Zophobas morio]
MSCLEQGSPKHTLLYCTIWKKEEKQCRIAIGVKITVHTIIEQMGEDKYNYTSPGLWELLRKKCPLRSVRQFWEEKLHIWWVVPSGPSRSWDPGYTQMYFSLRY